MNIAHLVPIRKQTWPPQAILVSNWLISKKSFSIDASYQLSDHLACGFRGKDF
jgi:hypothetical protein